MSTPEPPQRPAVPAMDPAVPAVARTIPPPPEGTPAGRDIRRGWLMLGCFATAVVTFVVAGVLVLLAILIASPYPDAGEMLPPAASVAVLVVPTMLAASVATVGAALIGRGSLRQRLRGQLSVWWRPTDIGVGLALGVVSFFVITLPAGWLWVRWVGENRANSAVGEAFGDQRLPLGLGLTLFFAVWLVAPLCEEVLYRGVLWRALEHWQWNRWVIFGLTTLLFSFAHALFSFSYTELLRTPLLVAITVPIALARMLTGNLLTSIVAHQANNFLPAVGLLIATQGLLPG